MSTDRPMRPGAPRLAVVLAATCLVAGALGGCAAQSSPSPSEGVLPATATPPASATPLPATPSPATPTPASTPAQDVERLVEPFPYSAFADPTTIDHEFFPLVPGTQWVWEGMSGVGEDRLPHRIVTTVTTLTKVIDGIESRVNHDEDYEAGALVEAEIAFFAQDDTGAIWRMGEYPEEYEDGEFLEAPTWLAGIQDAKAGIAMKATPAFSAFSYSQGWGPAVGWTDRARVLEMGSRTCVPAGCYDHVLVTDEFNPDEPDAHQLKYYAPGVGVVRVGWAGALEPTQEELQLVSVRVLSPDELAKIEAKALSLEAHGYEISKNVYALTEPLSRD
jgi:hypothetical protein